MIEFPIPLAQTHRLYDEQALPLAGSRHVWWEEAVAYPSGEPLLYEDLSPELVKRLSKERAPLCGLTLDQPRIMGILNITPDSFSDGGQFAQTDAALHQAREIAEYAEIIDIGGESTRPGADDVPAADEIARVVPIIRAIRAEGISALISIDTRKAAVAAAALEAGADIINDVTAMRYDADMARVAAQSGAPICLMHSLADPQTMNAHAQYEDVLAEVYSHLSERIDVALAAGIDLKNIITDPGIGFAKTSAHNIELMRRLSAFHALGCPILLGASRKRFIGEIGGGLAQERLAGSLAVHLAAAAAGAQILRVHDCREMRQALSLWQAMAGENQEEE